MKKSQEMPIQLDQQNGFDPAAFLHSFLRLVKGTAKPTTCHINMIQLLLPIVSDWPIMIVGPGGFLLVVSHLFTVPVLVLWVGLQKSK
jgi:hypothetical protein